MTISEFFNGQSLYGRWVRNCLVGLLFLVSCVLTGLLAGLDASAWASWVQAVGSVVAIAAGFAGINVSMRHEARMQAHARKQVDLDQERALIQKLKSVLMLSGSVVSILSKLKTWDIPEKQDTISPGEFMVWLGALELELKGISSFLNRIGPMEFDMWEPVVATQVALAVAEDFRLKIGYAKTAKIERKYKSGVLNKLGEDFVNDLKPKLADLALVIARRSEAHASDASSLC